MEKRLQKSLSKTYEHYHYVWRWQVYYGGPTDPAAVSLRGLLDHMENIAQAHGFENRLRKKRVVADQYMDQRLADEEAAIPESEKFCPDCLEGRSGPGPQEIN